MPVMRKDMNQVNVRLSDAAIAGMKRLQEHHGRGFSKMSQPVLFEMLIAQAVEQIDGVKKSRKIKRAS